MAEKSKIQLNTSDIIRKLHETAMQQAQTGDFSVFNSLVEMDQNDGESFILAVRKDGNSVQEEDKSKCLDVIKTYVKYFAGENYADVIKKEQLGEIESTQSGNSEEQPDGGEQKGAEQQQGASDDTGTEEKSVSESILYISRLDRMVETTIDMIFEAFDPKSGYGLIKGYGIFYHCNSFGERLKTLKSVGGKANQTLFSGVLADLANVKIKTLGGGEIAIGKAIANGMRAFRRTRININDVDNHIRGIIKNDFPQSSAIVRIYDVMSLRRMIANTDKYRNKLNEFDRICGLKAPKAGEGDNQVRYRMFGKSEYAVTIEVDPVRDKAAKEYTTKKIAEICTRAFGDSLKFKLLRGNHVSESDVLELKDYDSEYMDQSIYNRRSAGKDSSSATNESIQSDSFGGDVDKLLDVLFESHKKRRKSKQNTPPGDESSHSSSSVPSPNPPPPPAGSEISVSFHVKDPTKENALEREIGVVVAEPGHILSSLDSQIPEWQNLLSSYISANYDFKYWNPDPDEFTKNAEHKEDGKTSYVPNVTHATFEKQREPRHNILFIVPHPMLGSFNRKDEYSVANDGTVTSKMSKQDFKPEDFQR